MEKERERASCVDVEVAKSRCGTRMCMMGGEREKRGEGGNSGEEKKRGENEVVGALDRKHK